MITRTDPRHDSVLTSRNDNNQLHSTIQLQQETTNESTINQIQQTSNNKKNAKGLFPTNTKNTRKLSPP